MTNLGHVPTIEDMGTFHLPWFIRCESLSPIKSSPLDMPISLDKTPTAQGQRDELSEFSDVLGILYKGPDTSLE